MNRRKKTPSLNLPSLLLLLIAGTIVATGGVTYVVVKNRQVTLRKEMERSEQRQHEHKVAIAEFQADIEEALGVFGLRERLATSRSDLRRIPAGVIEKYNPAPPGSNAVAAR